MDQLKRFLPKPPDLTEKLVTEQAKTDLIFHGALQSRHKLSLIGEALNLKAIDQTTGLERRILLSRGGENIKNGNLVLVTASRLGVKGSQNALFAIGGMPHDSGVLKPEPHFFKFIVKKGGSSVEGSFLGIVLNHKSPLIKKVKIVGTKGDISLEVNSPRDIDAFSQIIIEVVEAVIQAEINWTLWQKIHSGITILNQQQLDAVLNSITTDQSPVEQ